MLICLDFEKEINMKYNHWGEWWGYSKKMDNLDGKYYHFYSWATNMTGNSFKRAMKSDKRFGKVESINFFSITKECT